MAESFRCPDCGALNARGAEWCGQCLTRFVTTPPPPPPPPPGAAAPAAPTTQPGHAPGSAPAARPRTTGRKGAFTVTETGITWRCSRCDTDNPLEAQVCSVCGTTFADSMQPPKERVEHDPNTVALYSLFFPGAGHWFMDMRPQAIARGVLSVWVIAVALITGIQGSLVLALPFAAVAFVLWVLGSHDAYREARGEHSSVILKGRMWLAIVLGLLFLIFIALVTAAIRAR
ncbi:MAG: hypothetical protein ACRDI3_02110 [Actinomycetota bacterium]